MKYTVEYFILKARNIPSKYWVTSEQSASNPDFAYLSVYGHLVYSVPGDYLNKSNDLRSLFKKIGRYPADVNDNVSKEFPQGAPKDRVIAALYKIKSIGHEKS